MPEVLRLWTINGLKPLNPQILAKDATENDWPMDWYGLANGITVPRGWEAGVGHFLFTSADADSLASEGGPLTITCDHEGGTTQFPKWYYESRVAITKQKNPAYWVRLRDVRWMMADVSTQGVRFNLLKAESEYVEDTTNAFSGYPYTWGEVIQALWSLLPPTEAGSVPSLTYSTGTVPENLSFDGIPALRAIQQVLTALGCCLVFDPILGLFRIANLRQTPTFPTAALRPRLLWADNRVGTDIPGNVAIRFPMMPVSGNDYQPFLEPPHVESKAIAGGTGSEVFDIGETMFYSDDRASDITTRANEIATAVGALLNPTKYPAGATYSGIVPETPYERLTSIEWVSDGYNGMVTRFLYKQQPIDWPQMPGYFPGLEGDAKAIVFDLTASLASGHGNTASATVVISSHDSEFPAATAVTVYNTGQMVGISGARGVAILFADQWWVVDLNQPTTLAFFTFTNSTHAAASEGAFGSVAAQQTITHSGLTSLTPYPLNALPTANVSNPYNLVALSGDLGLCSRNLSTGLYHLIAVHPPKARRFYFKLTSAWPNGLQQTSTYATAQYPDPINQGGDLNYGAGTITLYDRWNVAHNAQTDDVGLCQLNYATGYFDIIEVEHEMTRGRGEVYATESGTPSTIQVENVVSFDGSIPADDPLELSNELNIESVTEGQKVEIRWNPITGAYYAIPATGGGRVIPVVLERVGGSQGDNEDPASWTYDVKDFYDTGLVLLEAVNPTSSPHKFKRPSVGQMTEATFGYAHYDAEGELVIGWINEVPEQEACEEA